MGINRGGYRKATITDNVLTTAVIVRNRGGF
jgi:hypothetical protein